MPPVAAKLVPITELGIGTAKVRARVNSSKLLPLKAVHEAECLLPTPLAAFPQIADSETQVVADADVCPTEADKVETPAEGQNPRPRTVTDTDPEVGEFLTTWQLTEADPKVTDREADPFRSATEITTCPNECPPPLAWDPREYLEQTLESDFHCVDIELLPAPSTPRTEKPICSEKCAPTLVTDIDTVLGELALAESLNSGACTVYTLLREPKLITEKTTA